MYYFEIGKSSSSFLKNEISKSITNYIKHRISILSFLVSQLNLKLEFQLNMHQD